MTIDQKLEILKRAMELGASVDIRFFASKEPRNKEEAYKLANHFPEFKISDLDGSLWLRAESNIEGAVFYD